MSAKRAKRTRAICRALEPERDTEGLLLAVGVAKLHGYRPRFLRRIVTDAVVNIEAATQAREAVLREERRRERSA